MVESANTPMQESKWMSIVEYACPEDIPHASVAFHDGYPVSKIGKREYGGQAKVWATAGEQSAAGEKPSRRILMITHTVEKV